MLQASGICAAKLRPIAAYGRVRALAAAAAVVIAASTAGVPSASSRAHEAACAPRSGRVILLSPLVLGRGDVDTRYANDGTVRSRLWGNAAFVRRFRRQSGGTLGLNTFESGASAFKSSASAHRALVGVAAALRSQTPSYAVARPALGSEAVLLRATYYRGGYHWQNDVLIWRYRCVLGLINGEGLAATVPARDVVALARRQQHRIGDALTP